MSKLIENEFPFARLSVIAEHESWRKEIYRPVYYLHKWWARRLGSVFRGIVLGACLEAGDDFWNRFYHRNTFNNAIIFDPFMGSGVTIGEAIKLGCQVVGRDINPIAYLACRAAFSSYSQTEVLRVYQNLERTLGPKLLSYFATQTARGEDAIVLYYFLVKVVACPECGKQIDLFKRRIFSENAMPRKDPSARSVCPVCGGIAGTYYNAEQVRCPHCSQSYHPQQGNVNGANVHCNFCQTSFRLVDVMPSLEKPLGYRRYAKLIFTREGQKRYESLNQFDLELEKQIAAEFVDLADTFPEIAIEPGYNTNQILKHNYRYWHQLFSDRQLICISHLRQSICSIEDPELRLLFACLFSGVLEFNNLFTSFKGEGTGAVRHMFAHHILKPELMPLEANIWGMNKSSGAFSSLFHSRVERTLRYKANPVELQLNQSRATTVGGINHPLDVKISGSFAEFISPPNHVYLSCGDSSRVDLPDKSVNLVVTDPPFFDNVHYSQLADFFYYWLRQLLELPAGVTTRSTNEVQDTNPARFTAKLTAVLTECVRVLKDEGLLIFTYHHSRHEGWLAVHQAIRHSKIYCTQSYPIKAEMSVSMPLQQTKSPIHLDLILVCRKELNHPPEGTKSDPIQAALATARTQISLLRNAGIKVSLGDAKVILMGRFLCEIHKLQNLQTEANFLKMIAQDIDTFVNQVISAKSKVRYANTESLQLTLLDEIGKYLTNKQSS